MSTPASPPDETRALTLLRMLHEETRAGILNALPEELRGRLYEKLRAEGTRLPSPRKQQEIVQEFQRLFEILTQVGGPRLKLARPEEEPFEPDDDTPYVPTGNSIVDLERMNVFQLCGAFQEEQPRTVALLLQSLTSRRVAAILEELPEAHRSAVAREMAKNPQVPKPIIEKMADRLIARAAALPAPRRKAPDPIIRMADILRETDKQRRRELLASIQEDDADTAAELQQAIYRFEDLLELDDRQVQSVLSNVDTDTLLTALFEADPKILDKVKNNLSRRAAATLSEELTYQRRVSPEKRDLARAMIVKAIAKTEEEV